jgi:hypothetical protein
MVMGIGTGSALKNTLVCILVPAYVPKFYLINILIAYVWLILKGIVSPDWKGLQMISLDRFEV